MNMVRELVNKIEASFQRIKDHPKFIIRNRVYLGGGDYGEGLVRVHEKFTEIKRGISDIPALSMEYNMSSVKKILKNIEETLDLFNQFDIKGMEADSAKKFITVASIEVDTLGEKLKEIATIDVSSIPTSDMVEQEKIEHLRSKIEDNLNQITKSFEWKSYTAQNANSIEGREKITERSELIPKCLVLASKLSDSKNLSLVSILSMHYRDAAAKNLETIDLNLPLLSSICRIFNLYEEGKFNDDKLTAEAFRKDIEHMINTRRLAWLASIHHYYVISNDEKILMKFVEEFYNMSRDPKDQFQKTLTIVARSQKNQQLDDITVKYANLASTVLSLRGKIEELGLSELIHLIEEIESMTIFDTIDINDLYHPENIEISHLVNTVSQQVKKLKELAQKIILIDELKEDLFTMIQFTDFEAELQDPDDLLAYFRKF